MDDEILMDEKLNWLMLADKFSMEGDPMGMRACARELFEADPGSADGPAVMAEAALYTGSIDEAESLAHDAYGMEPKNLRARLVLAGVAAQKFELAEELSLLQGLLRDVRRQMEKADKIKRDQRLRMHFAKEADPVGMERAARKEAEDRERILRYLLFRGLCLLADASYLAADPQTAAESLEEASTLATDPEQKGELYSKHLFLTNYRSASPQKVRMLAEKYQGFLEGILPYPQDKVKLSPDKKLRIGYISPDFRRHAVANFLLPLFRDFDRANYSVYCYSTGRSDDVTDRLRRHPVSWRDVRSRSPRTVARMIAEDRIDILVDLSGHSQNNCLPIMAFHAAPIQICAIGYTATTGMSAMDFFLSDKVCLPEREQSKAFTEKILRLGRCSFCYAPGIIRDMPPCGTRPPSFEKGYVTYGSFNNFAKASDDVLYLWRAILEGVEDSRLVIKGKICSIPSGMEILEKRLRKMSFPMERVEMRPYSPDYLEQYRDIDVALDTFPYTGGLTTCEALYMGVPVVTLRGRSHGARLGASILTGGDLAELIAESSMEYIKKAVQLAKRKELLAGYHAGLREHLLKSSLMDSKGYMRDLEGHYRTLWEDYCREKRV